MVICKQRNLHWSKYLYFVQIWVSWIELLTFIAHSKNKNLRFQIFRCKLHHRCIQVSFDFIHVLINMTPVQRYDCKATKPCCLNKFMPATCRGVGVFIFVTYNDIPDNGYWFQRWLLSTIWWKTLSRECYLYAHESNVPSGATFSFILLLLHQTRQRLGILRI